MSIVYDGKYSLYFESHESTNLYNGIINYSRRADYQWNTARAVTNIISVPSGSFKVQVLNLPQNFRYSLNWYETNTHESYIGGSSYYTHNEEISMNGKQFITVLFAKTDDSVITNGELDGVEIIANDINEGNRVNTWTDFSLIPSNRIDVKPPTMKKNTVEIPGANGLIDLSTSLTGYPVYNNRTDKIEFIVDTETTTWEEAITKALNFFNGRVMKMISSEEPDYYYEGRFIVNSTQSKKDWSTISIDYDLYPYRKWAKSSEAKDNSKFSKSLDAGTVIMELGQSDIGTMPVVPSFKYFSSGTKDLELTISNPELGISKIIDVDENKTFTDYDVIFSCTNPNNKIRIVASGTGQLTIKFVGGIL